MPGTFGLGDLVNKIGGVENLSDYTHAAKTFRTSAYELKPRFKFSFHVLFTINVMEIPSLRGAMGLMDINNLSLTVKTADLPKYSISTDTLNQYNRKRVVQTKINYDPVNITFHDDGGDLVRNMWYNYYSYYYKDASQQYGAQSENGITGLLGNRTAGFGYNTRDIYNNNRLVNDWGYIGETPSDGVQTGSGKPPFFRDIRIFGFDYAKKYAEYVLINPIITNWSHDTYDYSQGNGIMQHQMTIAYETVKYYQGWPNIGVPGFANPMHYDVRLSPISIGSEAAATMIGGSLMQASQSLNVTPP